MKRITSILLILVLALLVFACSEKDDDPTDVKVWGYQLDQFITKAAVAAITDGAADTLDLRDLYAYEIVAEDGWSPRQSVNAGYDLAWENFSPHYIVPSDGNRIWLTDPKLPSAFKVRDTAEFRLYRKIRIDTGRAIKDVELGGLTIHQIPNWDGITEDAVKLSELLAGVASYDSLSVVCFDGYGEGKYYQAEAVNDGYYLLNTERTIFPTASIPNNMKKMKKVAYLRVFGATMNDHVYSNADRTKADLVVTRPASFESYIRTEMQTGE